MNVVGCRRALCANVTLFLLVAQASIATTIVEKDLDALAAEADQVFVGTVSAVQSQWSDPQQHNIETFVTFSDIEPLFGTGTSDIVLRFSGGRVGDVAEYVAGAPTFAVGDRLIIFARNERSVSPIVGFNQGCLPVTGDGDSATVTLTARTPIATLPNGQRLLSEVPQGQTEMPLRDFLVDVRRRLAGRTGGHP